jgi:hypothetical protein
MAETKLSRLYPIRIRHGIAGVQIPVDRPTQRGLLEIGGAPKSHKGQGQEKQQRGFHRPIKTTVQKY